MVNPPRSPRTPSALRQVINVFDDEPATDVTDNEDVSPDPSPSHGRERPELPLPTTVTLRKAREDRVKIRQAPKERTYTKFYFDIEQLDQVWCKTQNKGSPLVLQILYLHLYRLQQAWKYHEYRKTSRKGARLHQSHASAR